MDTELDISIADPRLFLLIAAISSLLGSIAFFIHKKINIAVFLLFIFAFSIFLFAALLDPFLNLWDERFHALVAKNLLNHPLKPTLYDNPVITMVYAPWDRYIIWLHKQPFFLWQIALSIKVFGVNEFAVRFPSVLLCSLLVPIFYRSGKILVNQETGYYTAFFVASSFFLIELISGHQGIDHNDAVFFFYVSTSIWAWIEFIDSGRKYWLLLIAISAGFAILTKWLVGLVVYAGWAIYIVTDKSKRSDRTAYIYLAVSLIITCLIVLPWQILIFSRYPAEARMAFHYNTDHFFKVIEGHEEPWWYYFANWMNMYGFLSVILIPAGWVLLFRKIRMGMNVKIAMVALPVIVYLFFSVARTKMASFPFVISLPVFMGMACVVDYITEKLLLLKLPSFLKRTFIILLLLLVLGFNIRFGEIIRDHSFQGTKDRYAQILGDNKKIFLRYKSLLPSTSVIFNLRGRTYLDCMFYSGFPAYNFLPSEEQYLELKNKGEYRIVVVNIARKDCPDYLKNDASVIVLNDAVLSFD